MTLAPARRWRAWWLGLAVGSWLIPSAPAAESKAPDPAQFKISGFGILGNRKLKTHLATIELAGKKPEFFTPTFLEDASLLLLSEIKQQGFLKPELWASVTLEDGRRLNLKLNDIIQNPLPQTLRIRKVHFKIHKGVLFHYRHLVFQGLETIPEEKARPYFVETGSLLRFKSILVYTPEKLNRSMFNLKEVLRRQGYQEVSVVVSQLLQDDRSGAVDVTIRVEQGPKWIVRSVREEYYYEAQTQASERRTVFPNQAYSSFWVEDFTLALKTNNYHLGYPDTTVTLQTNRQQRIGQTNFLDMLAQVKSGPQIKLGRVSFEGNKQTQTSVLQRTAHLHPGILLDRIQVEQARLRLSALGPFESVTTRLDPSEPHIRNVVYQVKERKRTEVSLLFGYGSYEMLRGGIDLEQRNLWGRAHLVHLRLTQSFKSSSGEFRYTVPQALGPDTDIFANGTGLLRQEVSFKREEYGGGVGVHQFFRNHSTDLTARYNYQVLNTMDFQPAFREDGLPNPGVSAFITDLRYDREDHPLYPHRGFKLANHLELATRYFGADVNYQRLDLVAGYHHPLGEGHWVHLALTQGALVSFGSPGANLPFDRRYFTGGENSIRGYLEGRAAPRNEFGQFVGAETYLLGTVQFEQALTPNWSFVFFSDNIVQARRLDNYPGNEYMSSAGAGLWWKTVVGPVRLEYAYNVKRRQHDPYGTLHFALGFPF